MSTVTEEVRLTPSYVIETYESYKARERSHRTVAKSNWPTVLAHPCEAYAVYMRTVPPDRRRKIGSDLAMIFSEGNDQARMIKRDLIDAGFEVSGEEEEMRWDAYQISGRRDLLLWKPGMREKVRVEVKSCAPYTFDSIHSVNDLVTSSKNWMVRWARQVALYMVLQGVERYWMMLKNKSNGKLKIIEFLMNDEILEFGEAMIAKAERVNKLVQIGAMPPAETKLSDADYCAECEFFDVCLPELTFGPGAKVLTDEEAGELQMMLERREELAPMKREYESLDSDLKDAVKGVANGSDKVLVGDWVATLSKSQRKAYSVAAQEVTTVKFIKPKGRL